MSYMLKGSLLGLFFLFLIIAAIPCWLLWVFISPVTIWQSIAMIVISGVVFFFMIILELIVLFIFYD